MTNDTPEIHTIDHDGFTGTIIGHYTTREGKEGVVLQQVGTRVVHVYGVKWLKDYDAVAQVVDISILAKAIAAWDNQVTQFDCGHIVNLDLDVVFEAARKWLTHGNNSTIDMEILISECDAALDGEIKSHCSPKYVIATLLRYLQTSGHLRAKPMLSDLTNDAPIVKKSDESVQTASDQTCAKPPCPQGLSCSGDGWDCVDDGACKETGKSIHEEREQMAEAVLDLADKIFRDHLDNFIKPVILEKHTAIIDKLRKERR